MSIHDEVLCCEDYLTDGIHEHFSLKTNKWKLVLPMYLTNFICMYISRCYRVYLINYSDMTI